MAVDTKQCSRKTLETGIWLQQCTIDERVKNAKLVKEITAENSKIEKKYNSLVVEVKKMMDRAEKRTVKENLAWSPGLRTSLQLLRRSWGRRRGSS
jgi:hypothetical protein